MKENKNISDVPHWDITGIYPSFSTNEYKNDKTRLSIVISEMEEACKAGFDSPELLYGFLKQYEEAAMLHENLLSFAYVLYSVNTSDTDALKELGKLEELDVPFSALMANFRNSISEAKESLENWIKIDDRIKPFSFFIEEQLQMQKHQMPPEMEHLAADLSRSGGEAWSRLQQKVSSNISGIWKNPATGKEEEKTVIELRGFAYHPDRNVRKAAYEKELGLWNQVEIPMAASLNGVKGWAITTNKRRDWEDALERSVFMSRITKKTLSAMIGAMEESLPQFREYLHKKAKLLSIPACGFYDIFAPLPSADDEKIWSFDEAKTFICKNFHRFSTDLGNFAEKAFSKRWIDAKPVKGKVGGAYCISFPLAKETRILSNFTGTYSDVGTLAHELGHGYHHHILKDSLQVDRMYPMTLAETASIFSEQIVFDGAAQDENFNKSRIIEAFLQDATQVIVDILSRFYFEKSVFDIRQDRELSAEEFCSLMTDAQKRTYGDGLDPKLLHPYMWAVKGHYYSPELAFYNFPYAFGLLFGLGLFSLYKKRGTQFSEDYIRILKGTGQMSAVELCKTAGFDIETPNFWAAGLETVNSYIKTL